MREHPDSEFVSGAKVELERKKADVANTPEALLAFAETNPSHRSAKSFRSRAEKMVYDKTLRVINHGLRTAKTAEEFEALMDACERYIRLYPNGSQRKHVDAAAARARDVRLVLAVQNGQVDVVRAMLKRGANANLITLKKGPNQTDSKPLTVMAILRGDAAVVDALLEGGASVDANPAGDAISLVHLSVIQKRPTIVEQLIARGAKLNPSYAWGPCALEAAIRAKDEAMVRLLIDAGAHADILLREEGNKLWLASAYAEKKGPTKIAAVLKSRSVRMAVLDNEADRLNTIIEAGAKLDLYANRDSLTELHHAAYGGKSTVIPVLLKHGAKVDAVCSMRTEAFYKLTELTPLHLAAMQGNAETVRLLLKAGANVTAITSQNTTALHLAAHGGKTEAVQELLKHGAKSEDESSMGTPLLIATRGGYIACVEALVAGGASPTTSSTVKSSINDSNPKKVTPFRIALQSGDIRLLRPMVVEGVKLARVNPERTVVVAGQVFSNKLSNITKIHVTRLWRDGDTDMRLSYTLKPDKGGVIKPTKAVPVGGRGIRMLDGAQVTQSHSVYGRSSDAKPSITMRSTGKLKVTGVFLFSTQEGKHTLLSLKHAVSPPGSVDLSKVWLVAEDTSIGRTKADETLKALADVVSAGLLKQGVAVFEVSDAGGAKLLP